MNPVQPQGEGNPTLTPCLRRGVAGERGLADTFWFYMNSRDDFIPIVLVERGEDSGYSYWNNIPLGMVGIYAPVP